MRRKKEPFVGLWIAIAIIMALGCLIAYCDDVRAQPPLKVDTSWCYREFAYGDTIRFLAQSRAEWAYRIECDKWDMPFYRADVKMKVDTTYYLTPEQIAWLDVMSGAYLADTANFGASIKDSVIPDDTACVPWHGSVDTTLKSLSARIDSLVEVIEGCLNSSQTKGK